jgi:hypothetical protein
MNEIKIQLLYGSEFWNKLRELCTNAKSRAIFASAYIKLATVNEYRNLLQSTVTHYLICRDDNNSRDFPATKLIKVNSRYFHGKIYLIDNVVIIGSQNLNNANKEGEFNVMFELTNDDASTMFYQSLIKIIEDDPISAEPVNPDFLGLYDVKSQCPFCSNEFSDPGDIHTCPGYGGGSGFVSDYDCEGYGGEGACQWCFTENREPIPEALVCDDSGCGFGINTVDYTLMYHAINPPEGEKKRKALEFLRLFNFIHRSLRSDTVAFFKSIGLLGRVYKTSLVRDSISVYLS